MGSFTRWIVFLSLDIITTVVGFIFAPLFALALNPKTKMYPTYLSWFQTPDSDACGGGEPEFVKKWGNKSMWTRAVLWQWRNPAYGFSYSVLAAKIPQGTTVFYKGNPNISNTTPFTPGWCYITSDKHWRYYLVLPSFPGKCLRVNLGWKLTVDGNNNPAQFVFSVNPFMNRG